MQSQTRGRPFSPRWVHDSAHVTAGRPAQGGREAENRDAHKPPPTADLKPTAVPEVPAEELPHCAMRIARAHHGSCAPALAAPQARSTDEGVRVTDSPGSEDSMLTTPPRPARGLLVAGGFLAADLRPQRRRREPVAGQQATFHAYDRRPRSRSADAGRNSSAGAAEDAGVRRPPPLRGLHGNGGARARTDNLRLVRDQKGGHCARESPVGRTDRTAAMWPRAMSRWPVR